MRRQQRGYCQDCGDACTLGAKRCLPCANLHRAQQASRVRIPPPECPVYVDPFDDCPELFGAFVPHPGGAL